ncbi:MULTISPECIES: ATP-binding cassette domain-containing protein [Bacillaceae]|uniref:energy-coupling factor ABC transporter ATP-binding protein n=1 Tax=Bacillaceae TaxID=186817 RepID=UPI001BDE8A7D|nr:MULTISPECIES: ATP-binding cassette domain-containing protein [Bacillaceae]MDX8367325.1 ATP-binding cassette domain-containing protein [Cytobacillus sp. IB215665]
MSTPIIELENITYQYPDGTDAINNISLSIEQGKKIALLGNNGAGKSTLFLHFNGILQPTSGSICFQGETLRYKRKEIKRLRQQVGIVYQDSDSQLFSSSVYQDIKYGPKNMGLSESEVELAVDKAMMLTETTALKEKPPHFLSIGQKKRVAIAGIVAMEPKLMVLDEPTAGLDPYYAKKIMNVLHDIQTENKTMIVSTHDVNLAYEWADEIIVMNEGRIIAQDKPDQVFRDDAILQKSHLEKPWIIDVFEQLRVKDRFNSCTIPKTKNEIMKLLAEI